MKKSVVVVFCLSVLSLISCDQVEYGTTISVKNQLNDTVSIKLYPKDNPYPSYYQGFDFSVNNYHGIYSRVGHDKDATTIMQEEIDSVIVSYGNNLIKFTKDTVIGYAVNMYTDSSKWTKQFVSYRESTNASGTTHEDIIYTFTLTMDDLAF